MKKTTTLLLSLSILLVFTSAQASSLERLFAPKPKLWDTWLAHDPGSSKNIDHQVWSGFLQRNVTEQADGVNRVDYGKVTDDDRQRLKEYISGLSRLEISSYSRAAQLNYWINLYNALTIDVILDHYPVSSMVLPRKNGPLVKSGFLLFKFYRADISYVTMTTFSIVEALNIFEYIGTCFISCTITYPVNPFTLQ